jgi:hypothetical protein
MICKGRVGPLIPNPELSTLINLQYVLNISPFVGAANFSATARQLNCFALQVKLLQLSIMVFKQLTVNHMIARGITMVTKELLLLASTYTWRANKHTCIQQSKVSPQL